MLDEATVRLLVGRECTEKKILDYYQTFYSNTRGYGERCIRRFCRAELIENFISLYGHGNCRSMMQGIIRYTLGIPSGIVSQRCIARSLKRSAPLAYEAWARDTLEPHTSVRKDIWIKMKKLLGNMVARMRL